VNLRQVADQRTKTGRFMIAFLNHPNFGWGVRAEEMLLVDGLKYFEVFNGHPGVKNYGDETHASTERVWDIALALRLGKHGLGVVYGLATDDSHAYHEWGLGKTNPGRGWVMVKAAHLTPDTLVKAIDAAGGAIARELGRARLDAKHALPIPIDDPRLVWSPVDGRSLNALYAKLGFGEVWRSEGWMILERGDAMLEFFVYPDLDPDSSSFGTCLRLDAMHEPYAAAVAAGIPEKPQGRPRLQAPRKEPSGLTIAYIVDPDGSLVRLIQNP